MFCCDLKVGYLENLGGFHLQYQIKMYAQALRFNNIEAFLIANFRNNLSINELKWEKAWETRNYTIALKRN